MSKGPELGKTKLKLDKANREVDKARSKAKEADVWKQRLQDLQYSFLSNHRTNTRTWRRRRDRIIL